MSRLQSTKVRIDRAFLPMRQSLFYFSDAYKFCLAHGLRQLTRDVKSDVKTVNYSISLTSLLTSRVSCLSPWARQNIPEI